MITRPIIIEKSTWVEKKQRRDDSEFIEEKKLNERRIVNNIAGISKKKRYEKTKKKTFRVDRILRCNLNTGRTGVIATFFCVAQRCLPRNKRPSFVRNKVIERVFCGTSRNSRKSVLIRGNAAVRNMERLSEHDKSILDVIFDPFQLMESDSSNRQSGDDSNDSTNRAEDNLPGDVVEILRRAVDASENGNFEGAFELFDKARIKAPSSPVVLNDRAQALRLVGRDDDALKDLNLAVELSEGRGKAGVQALCQRGVLHRCAGRTEEARQDFNLAAQRGSTFARKQLVNLNPYATMCNAMLRDISAKSSDY